MGDKQKKLVLCAIAGVLAGVAACGGAQGEPNAPGASRGNVPSGQDDGGVSKALHGCGQHDGSSCGTPEDHEH